MRVHRLAVRRIEDLLLATGGNREFHPVQMGLRELTGELTVGTVGGITLTHGSFCGDLHVSGTWSNDKLTVAVLLAADGIRALGKSAQPGDLAVAGRGREIEGRYRGQLEYLSINVDKAEVLNVAAVHGRRIDPEILDEAALMRLEDGRSIRLALRARSVVDGLRKGALEAISPAAERELVNDLLWEFTRCLSGVGSSEIRGWPADREPRLVLRIEEWIRNQPTRTSGVLEIARHFRVSPRHLYRAFHAEVGMSPAKYLKRYRLTQARLELLEADPATTTVTAVASSWGFWELGRFAVDYRRLFGECPSTTLRACATSSPA